MGDGGTPTATTATTATISSGRKVTLKAQPKLLVDVKLFLDDPHSTGTIPMPEGLVVDLIDHDPVADDPVASMTTDATGRIHLEMNWSELKEKSGEDHPDLFLILRLGGRFVDIAGGKLLDSDPGTLGTVLAFQRDLSTKDDAEVTRLHVVDAAFGASITAELIVKAAFPWVHDDVWDDEAIAAYGLFALDKANDMYLTEEEFTCEDLALMTLVQFAATRGLPLALENGSGMYRSTDDQWASAAAFEEVVRDTTAAVDLQKNASSPLPDWTDLVHGDLILRIPDKSADHVQVVAGDYSVDNLLIYQGGFGLPRLIGSAEKTGFGRPYIGKDVGKAVYDFLNKTYSRFRQPYGPGTGDVDAGVDTGKEYEDLIKVMYPYRWRYKEWN